MKLFLASFFTLGILFAFFLIIIAGIFYTLGIIEFWFLIVFTTIIFFFHWLLSPYISDIIFRWLYKLRWVGIKGIEEKDKEVANFIRKICEKNKIKVPKIGFIDDDNPQIFTYGSAAFNARIVFTQGIFTYLNKEEIKTVFAHEIGHIVHRDFIIMTLAAFLLALLYHISQAILRSEDRDRGRAVIVGIIAYIFYFVGTYVLLFLSRIREYFADEFAVKVTNNSDALASALIKVAYGIIARPEEKRQRGLMQGTRTLGIMDFKAAKGIGLSYITSLTLKSWEPIHKTFLFDLKNPWAFVYELHSSHPLVAKRIKRIDRIRDVRVFDFEKLEKTPINKKKLYANFLKDILFGFLPQVLFICFSILLSLQLFKIIILPFTLSQLIAIFMIGLGLSIIVKTLYRYSDETPEKTTVLECMGDVYSSPIKGKPVELEGNIVGRGVPGLILSEDMMFQDRSGLIYLNYEGLIPFFSNLIFALFKLEKLVGLPCKVYGWFIRGLSPRIELRMVKTKTREIRSWVKFWGIVIGCVITLIGILLFVI